MSALAGAAGTPASGFRVVRDDVDAAAARLWAAQHDHGNPADFRAGCRACGSSSAEAFRRGYRAGLVERVPS